MPNQNSDNQVILAQLTDLKDTLLGFAKSFNERLDKLDHRMSGLESKVEVIIQEQAEMKQDTKEIKKDVNALHGHIDDLTDRSGADKEKNAYLRQWVQRIAEELEFVKQKVF